MFDPTALAIGTGAAAPGLGAGYGYGTPQFAPPGLFGSVPGGFAPRFTPFTGPGVPGFGYAAQLPYQTQQPQLQLVPLLTPQGQVVGYVIAAIGQAAGAGLGIGFGVPQVAAQLGGMGAGFGQQQPFGLQQPFGQQQLFGQQPFGQQQPFGGVQGIPQPYYGLQIPGATGVGIGGFSPFQTQQPIPQQGQVPQLPLAWQQPQMPWQQPQMPWQQQMPFQQQTPWQQAGVGLSAGQPYLGGWVH
jgi:hypothetical protein